MSPDALRQSLQGDIVLPNEPGYEKALARWALNAERKAQAVVFPKDPPDIALAIAHARLNDLELAIRGGGHSTGGASSTEGLVIDLSRYINTVAIDSEKKLAYVGGGCTWKQVDEAAMQHGLATVGGTVNHTGVGGLTLGGGIGWLSGAHGLVVDNVVEATVVTSDGVVRTASETEDPDLYWAIRGGGCNFGVVTQFVLRLHPQRRTVYGGLLVFAPDKLEVLFKLFEEWQKTITDKEAIWFALGTDPAPTPTPGIMLTMFYNGSEEEGRINFKRFLDIGPVKDETGEIPYEQMNGVQNAALEPGFARLMRGAFQVKSHLPSMQKVLERIIELSNEEHTAVVGYEYLSMAKISSVQNGSCAHFRTKNANIFIVTTWKHHTTDNLSYARKMSRELASIVTEGQAEYLGPVTNRGYGNYDQDTYREGEVVVKDSAQLMFSENYPKLQVLKKKYDPNSIFSKWFPIIPAA